MEDDKKTVIKLTKKELSSERREREERERAQRHQRLVIVGLCVICVLFGIGLGFTIQNKIGQLPLPGQQQLSANRKLDVLEDYFNRVWLYKNDYEDLNTTLEDKAYYGMTNFEDDPYTAYMSAEELNDFSGSINMNYVGIGVSYSAYGGESTVVRVFKDSPAEAAGIQPGDIIAKVDGMDISGLEAKAIKAMVIGEEGTHVVITVNREGTLMDLDVVREKVDSTVYAELIDGVVLLNIYSFGNNTANEIVKYLDSYPEASEIIVDLRGDSGGYQDAVEAVASLFLPKDTVMMRQVYVDGSEASFKTSGQHYYEQFEHIAILTDGYTASAAEVLTIALKEMHPDVTIIGTTTYGKGVVQTTFPLSDGSAVKMTTSKWLSPNGVWINKEGITPDEEVLLNEAVYVTYGVFPENEEYAYDSVSVYTKAAQIGLNFLDYPVERSDGYFPQSFVTVLEQYQKERDLKVTGTLNQETYEAIISGVTREWTCNKSKDTQLSKALEILKQKG